MLEIAFLAGLAAACGRDDIVVYRVAKQPAQPAGAAAGMGMSDIPPEMMQSLVSEAASAGVSAEVAWTKPAGWVELPAGGMRKATYRTLPGGAGAEVSVIALAGDAGGPLSNVNRWRGQIGLDAIGEAELAASAERIKSPVGEALLVDFSAQGGAARNRVVAALLTAGGETWFFKMTGVEAEVGRAKPEFVELLKGLKKG